MIIQIKRNGIALRSAISFFLFIGDALYFSTIRLYFFDTLL